MAMERLLIIVDCKLPVSFILYTVVITCTTIGLIGDDSSVEV